MPGKLPQASPAIEWSYRISLGAKGLLGLTQLIGGIGLVLTPGDGIQKLVDWMTRNYLAEDPDAAIARHVANWADALSPASQNFYAVYLLAHGLLNFGVVVALLLRIRGAYHVSLAILGGFVIFQLVDFWHGHDPVLLILTAIDVVVIWLVVMERHNSRPKVPQHHVTTH